MLTKVNKKWKKKARQIKGTNKFVIYLYNAKAVRGGTSKPKDFAYKQSGRICKINEEGREIESHPFKELGDMITYINEHMRKKVMRNLKEKRTWN